MLIESKWRDGAGQWLQRGAGAGAGAPHNTGALGSFPRCSAQAHRHTHSPQQPPQASAKTQAGSGLARQCFSCSVSSTCPMFKLILLQQPANTAHQLSARDSVQQRQTQESVRYVLMAKWHWGCLEMHHSWGLQHSPSRWLQAPLAWVGGCGVLILTQGLLPRDAELWVPAAK